MQSRFEFLAQGGDPLPEQISLAPLMGEALSRSEVGLNGAEPEAVEKLFAGIGGVGHGAPPSCELIPRNAWAALRSIGLKNFHEIFSGGSLCAGATH
jgi:hypothetical protein